MKSGTTLVELMIFIAIVAVFLSIFVPAFSDWCFKISSYAELNKIRSGIRYAKILSDLIDGRVEVMVSKGIRVFSSEREFLNEGLKFLEVSGNDRFAFSDGIPYISGTMRIFSRKSLLATITVTPVVGKITLVQEW